ncbi:hypothetical protein SAMN06265348_1089 [Pedobacter westerhofensis]|uniref:Uncharacterized protein n=2 Tax=Pedobacter westerhofensis TaxID=425512 RepID=A0A521EED2_9SPHI|nr:hypothetical protein SAMN06265348_1089 [Pedobacter westerhofensis]
MELGLSQREVSQMINPGSNANLVGTIETETSSAAYTDSQLHILTKKFSRVAEIRQTEFDLIPDNRNQIKTVYTMADFYPSAKVEDKLVVKKIETIEKDLYPTGALYNMLEDGDFLNLPRTTKEITDEANRRFNKTWQTTDFVSPLDRATSIGIIVKTPPPADVTYQKAKFNG